MASSETDRRTDGCRHEKATLGRTINADGTSRVWQRCDHCGANVGGPGVAYRHAPFRNALDGLPVFDDYTHSRPPCVRCGKFGTQLHHWFPRHTAQANAMGPLEHELWPTGWLCPDCHDTWHRLVEGDRRTANHPTSTAERIYAPDDPERPF